MLGEVILIFLGINLAIWFNNWNANIKSNRDKKLVINKILEEVEHNKAEVIKTLEAGLFVMDAFRAYQHMQDKKKGVPISSPEEMATFQAKHPGFFVIKDSIAMEGGTFLYEGGTSIRLELPNLQFIAWETAKTIQVIRDLEYDCLFRLERTYRLQQRVEDEFDKAANALQEQEMELLWRILDFIRQFSDQILIDYDEILANTDQC